MKNILVLLVFAFLAGCATATVPKEQPVVASSQSAGRASQEPQENVDIEGLERALKLSRPQEELGYQEAGFSSCSAGYGFSASRNCRKMVMAVIHVRLQCRDSEGTVSEALGAADLVAIAGQNIRWTLSRQEGIATSDGEGYAEFRGLFSRTPRNDWLRVGVGIQFLNVRAKEAGRVVAPRPWCHLN